MSGLLFLIPLTVRAERLRAIRAGQIAVLLPENPYGKLKMVTKLNCATRNTRKYLSIEKEAIV